MRPAFLRLACVLSALSVPLSVSPAPAKTLYVAQSGDGSDGTTWETAFHEINTAFDHANDNDDIWVKAGTYLESVTITKQISIYGGFSGNESLSDFDLLLLLGDWMKVTGASR